MTRLFSVPPHYGEVQQLGLDLEDDVDRLQKGDVDDPHVAPSSEQLSKQHAPILYLPPLLSSLPPSYRDSQNKGTAPLVHLGKPLVVPTTETHLPDIDPVSLSLHKALHQFQPIDRNYASKRLWDAFNWQEVGGRMEKEEEREWYVVAFRSRRRDGSDGGSLYEADRLAHEEAVQNGGLIMYWYGVPDPKTGLNLATCIWQSRRHAIEANKRAHHVRAAKLASASYEVYDLERYILLKVGGGGLEMKEWEGFGEVGW